MEDQKQVSIYTTDSCHFCHAAKDFFKENDVEYKEYNVGSDVEKRKEMVEKSGQMGVPVIDIGGAIVVGFDRPKVASLLGV